MKLSQVIRGFVVEATSGMDPEGLDNLEVTEVRDDSRKVQEGDLFVAVSGLGVDGHKYLADAAKRGASVAVVERLLPDVLIPQIVVRSSAEALAEIAQNRHRRPAEGLLLCAVTGTNGKTTTSFLLESMLQEAGMETGLIGTILYRYRNKSLPAPWTTPTPLDLHRVLREMRDAGVQAVTMEASSHALAQGRLGGLRYRACGFTNLTQDHLDFHGNMDHYFKAKARLFREHLLPESEGGVAIINLDAEYGRKMAKEVRGSRLLTVSTTGPADIRVQSKTLTSTGTLVVFDTPAGPLSVRSPLIGQYNLENLALAAGFGIGLGLDPACIAAGLGSLGGVPGRLERLQCQVGSPSIYVDYAHTPDALGRVIATLRPLLPDQEPKGRLILVFGCGGERDREKRPLMGELAQQADLAIVTSDNPRSEDPGAIIQAIVEGVSRGNSALPHLAKAEFASARRGHLVEPDRRQAIQLAVLSALPTDLVVIAGKGHEDYQIIGTVRHRFDDREEASKALRKKQEPGGVPQSIEEAISRPASGPPTQTPAPIAATIALPLERVVAATQGKLVSDKATSGKKFASVVIDGRLAQEGSLFVAIVGERQDGHLFIEQAIAAGAKGVLVQRGRGNLVSGHPDVAVIEVDDTTTALGQIARAHRTAPEIAKGLRVIAVTGSMGKTSTKDLIAALLESVASGAVCKTEGNLNNHYGLPLTLLTLRAGQRYAVVELGMSERGEIAYLTSLALPDVGVVTNVGPVHLESLGTVENVALAKGELLVGLSDDAVAVYPVGPSHELVMARARFAGCESGRLRAYAVEVLQKGAQPKESSGSKAFVQVEPLLSTDTGLSVRVTLGKVPPSSAANFEVQVPLIGEHQVHNIGLALAVALALDIPQGQIAAGLATVKPGKHRGLLKEIHGRRILDDCYNANPTSTKAALATIAGLKGNGRAIAVLADMLELGEQEHALHCEVGEEACRLSIDHLVTLGDRAKAIFETARGKIQAEHVESVQEAVHAIATQSREGDIVLVKGSRGMKLERVVELFAELPPSQLGTSSKR